MSRKREVQRTRHSGAAEEYEPDTEQNGDADSDRQDDAVIGIAFWSSLGLILTLAAVGALAIWYFKRPVTPVITEQSELKAPVSRDTSRIEIPRMKFTDITQESGLRFTHFTGARGEKLMPETMGGGCAFLDYDNDGDADILMINGCDWPWTNVPVDPQPTLALFANDGHGNFTDVTAQAGLQHTLYGMGMAAADYDNDGFVDLFISAVGRDYLFHNERGRFRDVTEEMGVAGADDQWGTSCCWFDFDNDGDLDLFVGNYIQWSREIDLSIHTTLDGKNRSYGPPLMFRGTFPYLYRNDGARFTDVTEQSGLQVRHPDTGVPVAKTMGVVPADLDNDGFVDLVVANDTVQNFLFHNLGNGSFREIAGDAGIAYDGRGDARGAMGIDIGRPRNDACWTIAIGNFANEMTAFYMSPKSPLHFFDAATATGLGPATRLYLTFGVLFVDLDLDGRLDLLAANGHLNDNINTVQETQHYEQSPRLYWNCGPRSKPEFLNVPPSNCGPDLALPMVGRGSAFADIDNDGDLDLLIAGNGSKPRLLRNDTELNRHWLRIKLVGTSSNRDAIGASVDVHRGDQVLPRYVNPCRSYLSHSELALTFGLGEAAAVDKVVIRWPGGQQQELTGLEVDRLHVIEQPREAN